MKTALFVALGFGLATAPACSKTTDDWSSYDGPRSACSTGMPYDLGNTFQQLDESRDFPTLPECVARCGAPSKAGYVPYGIVWSVAALPSGACANAGEACSMTAVRTLDCEPGRTVACSLTPYACRCEEDARWRCYSGPVGASACSCAAVDAGTATSD